jgi:hypothetical protein
MEEPHKVTRNGVDFSSVKILRGSIRNCWREIFFIFLKIKIRKEFRELSEMLSLSYSKEDEIAC